MSRPGTSVPLIGRDAELSLLRAAFDRACEGDAGAVLVAGDAGVGKTRLLAELTDHVTGAGALVLPGRCLDLQSGGLPYLPVVEALGRLIGDDAAEPALRSRPALGRLLSWLSDSAAPVLTPASAPGDDLAGIFGSSAAGDVGQLQLFEAVLGLLGELAAARPVVLVLEDLHWADASTRKLVSFLASRLRGQRLLVTVSYRGEDVHRRHPLRGVLAELARLPQVERLDLGPLEPGDARAFVTALAGEQVPPAVVDELVARSEGNAFFAEELVAAGGPSGEIPVGLADLLLARVERLGSGTRRVLRCAAVAGDGIGHAALAALAGSGQEDIEEALREAVHHHVLVAGDGTYRFRHALLQEAVYADLLPGERSRLHAAYAAWLGECESPWRGRDAALAHHSLRAKDFPLALNAAVRAADEAERLGAPGSALRHLEQALDVLDVVPVAQRPDVAESTLLARASACASVSGEPDRAIAFAREAVDRLPSDAVPARAVLAWHRLAEASAALDSTFDEAVSAIETAGRLLAEGGDAVPARDRAAVLETRARLLRVYDRHDEARVSAEEALDCARRAGAEAVELSALVVLGALADTAGDPAEARTRLAEARRRAGVLGAADVEARAGYLLALSHEDAGDLEPARELYGDCLARAEDAGLAWSGLGMSLRVRYLAMRFTTGRWPADDDVRDGGGKDGGGRDGTAPSTTAEAFVGAGQVDLDVARGRFAEAAELVERLRRHRRSDLWITLSAAAGGATLAYWQGDHADAAARAREGLDWLDEDFPWSPAGFRVGALGVEACAAWAATARRNGEDPAPAVAEGEALLARVRASRARAVPRSVSLGPEGRAWLARADAAATGLVGPADPEAWRETVAAHDYGAVYDRAVCRLHLAEALLAADHRDGAAAELTAAHEVASELGAIALRDALRALARRGGLAVSGLPAASPAGVLTGRERAVLDLVALGRTNRQIGEELYISEKTVSVHLSRAMAKLGVRRRAEAVAAAYGRGLLGEPG
ncbi:helix-turn-helix transcriptional regulator [Prauserella alba]|uniref:helix-turn-helix transcriptional regulator n=1 Tax=Prauserella alba TaxID=176898 RepID=UPI0020A49EFA|nr:AAA family ATPase [Prauserella alba]